MFKLVFHINEPQKWPMLLNNIHNTIQALQTDNVPFNIVIIANAGAVQGYLNSEIRQKITELVTDHQTEQLQFYACQNSLKGQDISLDELNPKNTPTTIDTVPVAIIALVEHQKAEFAYIKL